MIEVRFAKWWRHPEVVLEERAPEDWPGDRPIVYNTDPRLVLVGRGTPELVDVFAGEPLQLPNPRERRGKESRRSWRARWAHALAFASIETPDQALMFARRYGLLGLRRPPRVTPPEAAHKAVVQRLRGDRVDEPISLERLLEDFDRAWEEAEAPPEIPEEPVWKWLYWAGALREQLETVRAGWKTDREAAIEMATGWLDLQIAWELNDSPRLRLSGGRAELEYHRLLSALLAQAVMDLSNLDRPPVQCAGPGCGLWFIPTHPSALYCSEECRRSAQNRRAYRRGRPAARDEEAKQDAKGKKRSR